LGDEFDNSQLPFVRDAATVAVSGKHSYPFWTPFAEAPSQQSRKDRHRAWTAG
jgi:hypothetical protein